MHKYHKIVPFVLLVISFLSLHHVIGNVFSDYVGGGHWNPDIMNIRASSEYLFQGNPYYKAVYLFDGSGLINDLHGTTGNTMWLTEKPPAGPRIVEEHPAASNDLYWVEFDFGELYSLDTMWVWNYGAVNATGDYTDRGLKDVYIKTSLDGMNWVLFPGPGYSNTHQFAKTTTTMGVPFAHNTEIDFGARVARYVLIYNAPWNMNTVPHWGTTSGYWGLSEVRFNVLPKIKAYNPYPVNNSTGMGQELDLTWVEGESATSHDVYFGSDYNEVSSGQPGAYKGNLAMPEKVYSTGPLEAGKIYYWRIDAREGETTWEGDVWSFRTRFEGKKPGYPKIGNLWGVRFYQSPEIDYDAYGNFDLVITDLYGSLPEWQYFREQMEERNPQVKILRTGELVFFAPSDPRMISSDFVKRSNGETALFWADTHAIPNITLTSVYNKLLGFIETGAGPILDAGYADGLFFDGIVPISFFGDIDTDLNGVPDEASWVDPLWYERQNSFWAGIKNAHNNCIIMGNDGTRNPAAHGDYYNGALFEGHRLLDNVASGEVTPEEAVQTINAWLSSAQEPNVGFFIMGGPPMGDGVWRQGQGYDVTTDEELDLVWRDFPRMRLGLTTVLMTDAYYGYDFGTAAYGFPFWYAEYDARLGGPLSEHQTYENYMSREYENGIVILNPSAVSETIHLPRHMQRLEDEAAPKYVRMYDAISTGNFGDYSVSMSSSSWGAYAGAARFLGINYLKTTLPGRWLQWTFIAPSTDHYRFYVNLSSGSEFCPDAQYELVGSGHTVYIDQQTGGNGGWVELFSNDLNEGSTYTVRLTSGSGATMADVLRIESDSRFNDGMVTNHITLDPLDGIILMNVPPRLSHVYSFDGDGDIEGWSLTHNLNYALIENGYLSLNIAGPDPYMTSSPVQMDSNRYSCLKLRMKNNTDSETAEFFWRTDVDPVWNAAKRIAFSISSQDTEFKEYIVNLCPNANWSDTVIQIRLDPVLGDFDQVYIDELEMVYRPEEYFRGDLNLDGNFNLNDFEYMIHAWLQSAADIAPAPCGDGFMNIKDAAVLAEFWLE